MSVTEAERHHLIEQARAAVGSEAAMTLAALLPPVGWADVATKHDVDHVTLIGRADLHAATAQLRTEIAELRTELKTEIAELRTELHRSQRVLLQWIVGSMVALMVTFAAVILTAVNAMVTAHP